MLCSLHIRNYVLIDSLDTDFSEGLVIITGATGAGKSILLGALSLLTGGKADAGLISEGADSCVVEGEFSACDDDTLRKRLEESNVEWEDGRLLIRRVVYSTGRSRCFINDSPVNIQLLSDISSRLIDIHSQHKSLLLTDHTFQLSMLDSFSGNRGLVSECRSTWKDVLDSKKELESLINELSDADARNDYNESQFNELDAATLVEGELETLEAEQKSLSNAEEIKSLIAGALAAAGHRTDDDSPDLSTSLREMKKMTQQASKYLPGLSPLCDRIDSARLELEDICCELENCAENITFNQERLEQVEERLSLLYTLLRKHSCSTISELVALREKYSNALYDSYELRSRIRKVQEKLDAASGKHSELCRKLHERRINTAPSISDEITSSLSYLELDNSRFTVKVEDGAAGSDGADTVSFLFSSDGREPVDVSRCASGGELSRIMLSLKALMARYVGMPTLIFDEIDTGVSGSTAAKMGNMICRMGKYMQVFSITHLPQVAAKGDSHYLVSKHTESSTLRSVTGIRPLSGEDRVLEIARLLSSEHITPEAIANARNLLEERTI